MKRHITMKIVTCVLVIFSMVLSSGLATAQSNPLPPLKDRVTTQSHAQTIADQLLIQIEAYGPNYPQGDPTFDRLSRQYQAYHSISEGLNNPQTTVNMAVASTWTILVLPAPNAPSIVAPGYYNQTQWPADFRDLVNEFRL